MHQRNAEKRIMKRIDEKLQEILSEYRKRDHVKKVIKFNWEPDDVKCVLHINIDGDKCLLALDVYGLHDNVFMDEYGISVEGWENFDATEDIFLEIAKDNFWRDHERDQDEETE